jgi:hypothetical protein
MTKIAAVILALLLCAVTAASAQKMTVEELLKPYDAKTRPDYVPPASSPPARSSWPSFARSSDCRCQGCGCKGGSGWRDQAGRCVSNANLTRDCGSPPSTRCTHEGARQVC